jgi:hypothetical protein
VGFSETMFALEHSLSVVLHEAEQEEVVSGLAFRDFR